MILLFHKYSQYASYGWCDSENAINISFMKLINCDLGECLTPNPDEEIMPLIDMASVACGGHIGDDSSMVEAIKLAKQQEARIGVHPSYVDQANFGRVSHSVSLEELFQLIYKQVEHFKKLCEHQNTTLEYIKPHGALYHDMMQKQDVLNVLCEVIHTLDSSLCLVIQSGINTGLFEDISKDKNISFLYEVFADRGYHLHQLIPRGEQGAMLEDAQEIVDQYHYFSSDYASNIDTICFHSDNPASVEALKILKQS